MNPLLDVYGDILIVRPPVPATVNKAGANYKSEVAHLEYSPRRAYDEWLSILDAIALCGGDALYQFEAADEPFLDHRALEVDGDGAIRPAGSREVIGTIDTVMTGRVFAANGPWVTVRDGALRAVMPNMLAHRQSEAAYYEELLGELATAATLSLEIADNPHRWEGMADVATVGDRVVLTYAVPGHYDHATTPKSSRSTRDGVAFAASFAGVPDDARIYAELVYPHFHGDTVHFGARPTNAPPVLVHYAGGLYGDGAAAVARALGADRIVPIGKHDAVEQYAGNSRQVGRGVLVPDGVSPAFVAAIEALGLTTHRVPLFELFGKAGGGPACATLHLPRSLVVPSTHPLRYSATTAEVRARRDRIPELLRVDRAYFEGKIRG
jgi:N-dimethylarginine dimethylaminohydrolase